ncbi:MAG: hypothetical protein V3S19_00890 [Gemmatimonadales bacterium]
MTTSDRLLEVVAKMCPVAFARYIKTGRWGDPDPPAEGASKDDAPLVFHPSIVAPYVLKHVGTLRLVQVSTEKGDVLGGIGMTTAEAVTRLRRKVGLDTTGEKSNA